MKADETKDNVTRINRRQAMKAGLGGAAAAAALSVPNIEHFSLAPKTASAASLCPPGTTVTGTPASLSKTGNVTGLAACWGATNGFGQCKNASPGSITVAAASGQYTGPTIAFNAGGQVHNANGFVSWRPSNFTVNKPYASCSVKVSGTCQSGTFSGAGTYSIGTNGVDTTQAIRCSGAPISNITGTFTVAVTCICGPD